VIDHVSNRLDAPLIFWSALSDDSTIKEQAFNAEKPLGFLKNDFRKKTVRGGHISLSGGPARQGKPAELGAVGSAVPALRTGQK